jgi:hypothetical protein
MRSKEAQHNGALSSQTTASRHTTEHVTSIAIVCHDRQQREASHTCEVDTQHLVPQLIRKLVNGNARRHRLDACVVHQDVNAAAKRANGNKAGTRPVRSGSQQANRSCDIAYVCSSDDKQASKNKTQIRGEHAHVHE